MFKLDTMEYQESGINTNKMDITELNKQRLEWRNKWYGDIVRGKNIFNDDKTKLMKKLAILSKKAKSFDDFKKLDKKAEMLGRKYK